MTRCAVTHAVAAGVVVAGASPLRRLVLAVVAWALPARQPLGALLDSRKALSAAIGLE